MPQIIPSYLHPHVMTVINDNTEIQDVTAAVDEGLRSFFVISSPKGRDGEFVKIKSQSEFIEEFGRPNFEIHGQPALNAYAYAGQGRVVANILRVTADNAAYANSIVLAKVKADKATKKFSVQFVPTTIANLTEADEFALRIDQLEDTVADGDGFVTFPVFGVRSMGKGVYGDALRYRAVKAITYDAENAYLNYRFDVYEMDTYLREKGSVVGSIFEDALEGTTSLNLADLVEDDEKSKVALAIPSTSLKALYDLYIETVQPAIVVPYEEFDFFYGIDKAGDKIEGYTIEQTIEGAISLDTTEGVQLVGGTDGALVRPKNDTERVVFETTLSDLYSKAFRGEIDPKILSKRRMPSEFFFDANYPATVKTDIITLLNTRFDCYGHIDAGIIRSISELKNWSDQMYNLGAYIYGKEGQHYTIKDPFTAKRVKVTYTYFLAANLAAHCNNAGAFMPFVGNVAQLNGHMKNSLLPVIDADDLETKEYLYKNRVNYVEAIAENVFNRATQSTAKIGQSKNSWSDLNEENNVRTLLDVKRTIENLAASLTYNFAEADDRARFTADGQRLVEHHIGRGVRSITVEFTMNQFEELRSILKCNVAIVYRTMAKRHIIEIDINPRA